ncbi:tetraacyldisaccharide 4'-kinase [Natronospora cellulosivora (SeqCode)]
MLIKLEKYLLKIIAGEKKDVISSIVLLFLSLLEKVYLLLIKFRSFLYKRGFLKSRKLDCRLISIGNISVGGTGKTPFVKFLAEEYKKRGRRVVIISRGYKSKGKEARIVYDGEKLLVEKELISDEALMLSEKLKDVPLILAKNRFLAGQLAIKKFAPDIILLDDGFQHWQLKRDKDIVLIDALNPFAYKRLIPRGLLREPIEALKRANIIVISKTENLSSEEKDLICFTLQEFNDKANIYYAEYKVDCLLFFHKHQGNIQLIKKQPDYLKGKRVLAFSGIANPESFTKTLFSCKVRDLDHITFPDHYNYDFEDIKYIAEISSKEKYDTIITTEKDLARLNYKMKEVLLGKSKLNVLKIEMKLIQKDSLMKEIL